jgi:hypothetical protein
MGCLVLTAQLWRLFCCQRLPDAGSALQSGRYVDGTCLAHNPGGPGFHRLSIFTCRLYPRDLHHTKSCTNGVRIHCTVTGGGCQVPQEMDDPLSRRPISWLENMAERPCVFTATLLGQEAALQVHMFNNKFNAARGLISLC